MAHIGVIALSVLLLYGGVARALAGCSWQNHHDQTVSSIQSHAHHAHPEGESPPLSISCGSEIAYALSRSPSQPLKERIGPQGNPQWLVAPPRIAAEPPYIRPHRPPSLSVAVDSSDFLSFISVFRI